MDQRQRLLPGQRMDSLVGRAHRLETGATVTAKTGATIAVLVVWLLVACLVPAQVAVGQTMLRASPPVKHPRPAPSHHSDSNAKVRRGINAASETEPTPGVRIRHSDQRNETAYRQLSPATQKAITLQVALERAGFSPGIIDASVGRKTRAAVRAFQAAAGLSVTGRLDQATRRALSPEAIPVLRRYVLTKGDVALVGDCPTDWVKKSKARWLGFKSLATVAAYHGHCSTKLLARLNPSANIQSLAVGDALFLPDVTSNVKTPRVARIEIDFGTKMIRAFGRSGKQVGLFHCSIAREKRHRPSGPCKIKSITTRPKYLFKPESWPEVKGVHERLVIPPGPRNPVGLCWIGLSIRGYGIHGTPEPELIGKTGSHGCFRLTNWDALRLGNMLRVGVPVRLVDSSAKLARSG